MSQSSIVGHSPFAPCTRNDEDAFSKSREHRVSAVAHAVGAGAVLASDPATVRWLGIRAPQGTHALISAGAVLVLAPPTASVHRGLALERLDAPPAALRRALARIGLAPTAAVAIESGVLPVGLAAGLDDRDHLDVTPQLAALRMRKDDDEIELIERCAELVTAGHRALRDAATPGASELDLWSAAQTAMQQHAGAPIDVSIDLMVGARTCLVGAPPGHTRVAASEPILFDLAPRRDGYWADSCATFACGAPTLSLRRRLEAVRTALERGLETARPGVTAGAVDAAMRGVLDRAALTCPHHTGHGVGIAAQELPWIVPDDDTVLSEGMVVALEPGAYANGIGARLEHLVLITADGARPMTSHSVDLD
jgi:Xaa-Pro dipeptidase